MKLFGRKKRTAAARRDEAERGFGGDNVKDDEDKDKEVNDMEDENNIIPETEPEGTSLDDMSEDDFSEYIERMRNGEDETEPEETKPDEAEQEHEEDDEQPKPEPKDSEAAESKPEPWRTYATEDEYKADVDKAIADALRQRDLDTAAERARYERMERISRGFYPDDDNAWDKTADELEKQLAEQNDMSVEDYRASRETRDKAAKWDAQEREKLDGKAKQDQIVRKWVEDAGNLMRLYPDFSLEDALKNEKFAEALRGGGDMFSAYAECYLKGAAEPEPDKKEEEPGAASAKTETEKREPIPQNGSSKRRGTGTSAEDYSNMSSDNFKKEIKKMWGK